MRVQSEDCDDGFESLLEAARLAPTNTAVLKALAEYVKERGAGCFGSELWWRAGINAARIAYQESPHDSSALFLQAYLALGCHRHGGCETVTRKDIEWLLITAIDGQVSEEIRSEAALLLADLHIEQAMRVLHPLAQEHKRADHRILSALNHLQSYNFFFKM